MDTSLTSNQSDGISVVALPLEALPYYWEVVQPLLQKAVDKGSGEFTTDDVYLRLLDKLMQLLVVVDREKIIAAGVTEVVDYPQFRKLRAVLLGGENVHLWIEKMVEKLNEGAKAVGAKEIEAGGRRGWVRFFRKDSKVKESYCVLTREVDYGQ
jgi:hypothetical protein